MIMPEWDHHCFDFAFNHVKAVTGKDVLADLGGSPRNAKEAAALLKKLKSRTYKSAVTKVLGKPLPMAFAMRGDIVMVDNALGICRGELIECLDNMLPIHRGECAWRITDRL